MSHLSQGWQTAEQRGQKSNRIPPFAPSQKEQEFYKKYCEIVSASQTLPKRALILGATPELRDIAINVGLESIAVDISDKMMEKFSVLMEKQNHVLDKKIIKDWLEIDFPLGYFGIIMGDASLNNLVAIKDNERLINICHEILAKNGYFVLRQIFYVNDYQGYTDPKKVIDDYRAGKISWEDFFMELRINSFKDKVYSPENFQYNAGKAFALIEEIYQDGLITQLEYERINTFRNNLINSFYPKDEFVKMIESKEFKFLEEYHDNPSLFFKYLFMVAFEKV
ncbi:MAG: class I SAM-dependent methyltransferase [Patescibacteria group bacterium]